MADDQTTPVAESSSAEPPRAKTQKLAAHYALPMSGPDTLVKIIKGYAVASNGGESQVNYKDVASATGLAPSVVSRNNSFLTEALIITSPKYGYYLPSEAAVKFAREAAWDEPNAKRYLRSTIASTWFGSVVTQNFMTRPSLTREDLKRVLAIKSGATEGDAESLGRLIDFVAYTNAISENENGAFTRAAPMETGEMTQAASVDSSGKNKENGNASVLPSATVVRAELSGQNGVQINLNINIGSVRDLTDEDAVALRKWIQRFLAPEEKGLTEQP